MCLAWLGLPSSLPGQAAGDARAPTPEPAYLVIRSDDGGMSHSVNMGLARLIESGLPVSISVMFACPWYQETVELLKRHPDVSVGIHLTLNSEWKHLRWGPVAGAGTVPTLVDADGHFFPSGEALDANGPDPRELELELRAQIQRALRSGLRIDYVDFHMGMAVRRPAFREVTERLAREFGLGMSGYFGESMHSPQYGAAPAHKGDSLIALIERLEPGPHAVITHVGIDDAELGALVDMNTEYPLPEMSRHRQGELEALTSARFKKALEARGIRLMTYRQLIEMHGLQSMRRPEG